MNSKKKQAVTSKRERKHLLTALISRSRSQALAPISADEYPFVSVIVPSYNRRHFLPYLLYIYQYQDYPADRRELVILDDSPQSSQDLVDQLLGEHSGENVRYIFSPERLYLGQKRNMLNKLAKGEYLLCMDDDDYYPPDKISYTLREMQKTRALFSASGQIYIWYSHLDKIYKTSSLGPYYALNGTFAYHRDFLKNHLYDDKAMIAEEHVFLKGFTEQVLQIAAEKSILCISHSNNTYDKDFVMESCTPADFTLKDFIADKTLRAHYRRMSHAPVSQKVNWQAFEKIAVVVENRDQEQWQQLQARWQEMGMDSARLLPFSLDRHPHPAIAESQTHLEILTQAQQAGWKNVLILHANLHFLHQEKAIAKVNTLIEALEHVEWQVMMLGVDHHRIAPSVVLPGIVKMNHGEIPCAYAVNQPYFSTLIENYQQGLTLLLAQPEKRIYRLDQFWTSLMQRDTWLAMYPSFAYLPTLRYPKEPEPVDSAHRFFRKIADDKPLAKKQKVRK